MRRAFAALLALVAAGCSDQSMTRQAHYGANAAAAALPGGAAAQTPPAGAVAQDAAAAAADAATPPAVDMALLQRGHERFQIFCTPCHGFAGDGDGAVVRRGFPRPPSYFSPRLMQTDARQIFDTITNGFGVMYPYGARIPPHDRWAIVAYVRALQQTRSASLADAPEAAPAAGGGRP